MTRKPLIAVFADTRDIESNVWHAAPDQYLQAVAKGAAVNPIIVPALGEDLDLDMILGIVDGVLLTGSRTNVEPAHYGMTGTDDDGPFDPARDNTTLPAVRNIVEMGLPVLAICRGLQELNVALGGTLAREIQEQPGVNDHRAPDAIARDEKFALRHAVETRPEGYLAAIVGGNSIEVNSLHRQAIDRLAPGLTVEGRSEDGIIEAVSFADADRFVIGVQWHPEYWYDTDIPSKNIFKAFGDSVRRHAWRRTGRSAEEG
jgi:putative glutamine amidotransferase